MMEDLGNIGSILAHFFARLQPKLRWTVIISLILAILLLVATFEYFSGHFYYSHLEKKISLLKEMQAIANDDIAANPELYPIYQDAASELVSSRRVHPLTIPAITDPATFWKAITGASIWLLIMILGLFGALGEENKVAVSMFVGAIAAIFGFIGAAIPTILHPLVNYIGFPLIQLVVMVLLSRGKRRSENLSS